MANPFQLLAPALIPSWTFFDVIAPSPRIEYALVDDPAGEPHDWREFRPRPERLALAAMLGRLLWNPRWNETLFLVSCAERLVDQPTLHSEDEIFARVARDLAQRPAGGAAPAAWLRFRLAFIRRDGEAVARDVLFTSQPRRLAEIPVA